MSSVLRQIKEHKPIAERFTVFPYYGFSGFEYYFTVKGTSLFRIEADLSGNNQWVIARDMGKETFINTIDTELIDFWENENNWSNLTLIRKGRARKYQVLSIPKGSIDASQGSGPEWNSGAYTDPDAGIAGGNGPTYNRRFTGINDLLIGGYERTTIDNEYNQNLPFGTFWAVIDPVVIRYTDNSDGEIRTRSIVNRITQT